MDFTKILTWIKSNVWLSVIIGLIAVVLFFPKVISKLFGSSSRKRRRTIKPVIRIGRRKVKRQYNRSGKAKKPWQIKGSEAARRHMAKLRRMR
jgi:hypothetical protein